MEWLVVHRASSVVSAPAPIFSSANFRVPVAGNGLTARSKTIVRSLLGRCLNNPVHRLGGNRGVWRLYRNITPDGHHTRRLRK